VTRDRSHPVFVSQHFAALKAAVADAAEPASRAPTLPASEVLVAKRSDIAPPPSALELAEREKNRCQRGNICWKRHQFAGLFAPCTQCGQVRG
jgi:hypothetical protein